MKRILILTFYYKPDLCAGSFRCTALVDELAKTGANIHVVTTVPNRYKSFKVIAEKSNRADNILVERVLIPSHRSGIFDQIKSFYAFYKGAKKLVDANEYDLVFATSSRLFTAFLGAQVSRKKQLPLYLDIRDLFVDTISDIVSSKVVWLVKPILMLIEYYTFTSAKKVNLVSKGFLPYFRKRYSGIPTSFFTNGIDKEFIKASQHDQKIQIPKPIINILYAGNIGEGQGLHKVIPAMAARLKKRIYFKVIGSGGMIKELQDEVSKLCLDNVELLPPVDREALIKEYIQADILFLHLNNYEAFRKVLPSKLFEYGAMNKPILAGISGFSEEFVRSEISNCAVFSPADPEDGVEKIESLSLSITPRTEFIKKFDRQKIMSEMAKDIYEAC
jgi:glycosyltransferase involved in cell wall biosynthesis